MESGDTLCRSGTVGDDVDTDGNNCLGVEELIRAEESMSLKEESRKASGSGSHGENTKGQGLRRWKRRPRRDQGKDFFRFSESLRTLKRELSNPAKDNSGNHELRAGNALSDRLAKEISIQHLQTLKMSKDLDRNSDSGSWNARGGNLFAAIDHSDDQSSKSSVGTTLHKVMPENLLGKEVEENISTFVFDFGSQAEEKRSAVGIKKARGSKARKKSTCVEDSVSGANSSNADRVVVYDSPGHSANYSESVSIASVCNKLEENLDDNGDSIQSTGNCLSKPGTHYEKFLRDRNGGHWDEDNDIAFWSKPCQSAERENSVGACFSNSNGRENDEKNPNFCGGERPPSEKSESVACDFVSLTEKSESFASVFGSSTKNMEKDFQDAEQPDCQIPLQLQGIQLSDSLDDALTDLQMSQGLLQQELQRIKNLTNGIEMNSSWVMEINHGNESAVPDYNDGDVLTHEHDMSAIQSLSRRNEQLKTKHAPWQSELENITDVFTALQRQLEADNQEALPGYMTGLEIEVQCQEQESGTDNVNLPVEDTANEIKKLQEKYQRVERELEEQYRQRLQAEIESLYLREMAKDVFDLAETELFLLHEQKNLIAEQLQTARKMKETGVHLFSLKNQAAEIEDVYKSLSEKEDAEFMWKKIWRCGMLSLVQVLLLCIAFFMLFSPSPKPKTLVPT